MHVNCIFVSLVNIEFFKLVFGDYRESMLFEDPASGDTSVYMHLFPTHASKLANVHSLLAHVSEMIRAIFSTEIVKRIEMGTYKTAKSVPQPVSESCVAAICADLQAQQSPLVVKNASGWDRIVYSVEDCVAEIAACFQYFIANQPDRIGTWSFDKDDDVTMRFVSAAANLRSQIFSIPTLCFHDAKGIAGNIIPAIATTNAIVAGIQVQYAIRLLAPTGSIEEKLRRCAHLYCLRAPTRQGYFLQPTQPEGPNAKCFVCQTAQVIIQVGQRIDNTISLAMFSVFVSYLHAHLCLCLFLVG